MRTTTFTLVLILIVGLLNPAHAQNDICPIDDGGGTIASKANTQGIELNFPNEGTMNAFVIFVQHKDDDFEHPSDHVDCPDPSFTPDPNSWGSCWKEGETG